MTPAERGAVLRHAALFQRPIGDVLGALESYAALLRKWQPAQNLVSRETLPDLWARHFADSLQVLPHLGPQDLRILDLGSGAGFPALPLAIASGLSRRFVLLEPNQRKAAFLRAVARETGVDVKVVATRAEQYDSRETFDVVTSRAMAPLRELMRLGQRFLVPPARGLFHKGREHRVEIEEALRSFAFDVVAIESELDSKSAILAVANLSERS